MCRRAGVSANKEALQTKRQRAGTEGAVSARDARAGVWLHSTTPAPAFRVAQRPKRSRATSTLLALARVGAPVESRPARAHERASSVGAQRLLVAVVGPRGALIDVDARAARARPARGQRAARGGSAGRLALSAVRRS